MNNNIIYVIFGDFSKNYSKFFLIYKVIFYYILYFLVFYFLICIRVFLLLIIKFNKYIVFISLFFRWIDYFFFCFLSLFNVINEVMLGKL